MNGNAFFILFTLISLVFSGYSQTTKVKINDENFWGSYEEFYVLEANPEIMEGSYLRMIDKKPAIEGNYSNNRRCGIWKSYDSRGKVEYELDYTNGTMTYLAREPNSKKTVIKHDSIISDGDRPALRISGEYLFSSYINGLLDYPFSYRKEYNPNESGEVVIELKLNKDGSIQGYSIINSMGSLFDTEALSTVMSIPMEFLPEYKKGVAVDSKYNIWVRFMRN